MIYPEFLKKEKYIGVTAPSAGCENDMDFIRLDLAKENLVKMGYKIIETKNCRTDLDGRSDIGKERAKQFNSLIQNENVKSIICFAGGEFLLEILPYINYEAIKNNPKWVQGYSDPTGLLYSITTNLDIATIYGENFKSFAMNPMHESLINNLEMINGNIITQRSFEMYENERIEHITGDEIYNLCEKVMWTNLNNEKSIEMNGRIIGGCIDVLLSMIGTEFDGTLNFIEKYKEDGIIWYFDNCELTSEAIIRAMWQLKQMGYFKYTKGIIFGRTGVEKSSYNISFKNAIKQTLSDLNVSIILDADLGHKPPRMTIINGAIVNIRSSDGKGEIEFTLK